MGAWGTGILENDTTADVWVEFKDLYHQNKSLEEIRKHLVESYKPEKDDEEYAEIWTGIAYGQWNCGGVEDSTLDIINEIVDTGCGLSLWEEDEKLYKKRLKGIQEFLEKIKIPKEKPLKRKRIVPCPSYFKKGDIVSIQFASNQYAFAFVFQSDEDERDGGNLIVFSEHLSDTEITVDEFLNSEILYLDLGGDYQYSQGYFWGSFAARNMKRKIKHCKVIGNLQFEKYLGLSHGIGFPDWNSIEALYKEQSDFLKTNKSRKPYKITMKEFIHGKNPDFETKLSRHAWQLVNEKLERMNNSKE